MGDGLGSGESAEVVGGGGAHRSACELARSWDEIRRSRGAVRTMGAAHRSARHTPAAKDSDAHGDNDAASDLDVMIAERQTSP